MDVILLENISKLGRLGETVKVKAGFGRNYLIPQGKAVHATEENTASFEARRAELEAAAAAQMAEAQLRADAINALGTITITANAGEEGKLFGSVGTRDIADAIVAHRRDCAGRGHRRVKTPVAARRVRPPDPVQALVTRDRCFFMRKKRQSLARQTFAHSLAIIFIVPGHQLGAFSL